MLALAGELQQCGAELLVILEDPQTLVLAQTPLPLAEPVPEWLSPVTPIIPGQLLALHLAIARGLNPDVPRGLTKVTRTF
jgi:glutamine---fructose-6-phosphate transaminase (isomerizing)